MPKEFRGHLTINFSDDGLVYAADRNANRIHVTDKQGNFKKEIRLAEYTGVGGSTGGVAFSPDKAQRFLFISDLTNNHIWFLNRDDGKIVDISGHSSSDAWTEDFEWGPAPPNKMTYDAAPPRPGRS